MIVPDPFKLAKIILVIQIRSIVAILKIMGYIFYFGIEVAWYVAHGRRDRIGEAIGRFGQSTVDAFGDIFRL